MGFTNRSMLTKTNDRMRTFKYLTMFFLGMSCVLFAVRAFNISPIARNAHIIIQRITLNKSGTVPSATGIFLDGIDGNAWFKQDVAIASLPNAVVLGTDQAGKIVVSSASGIYTYISSYLGSGGGSLRAQATGTNNIYNKNYETGFVGVGLTGPTQALQVYGNLIAGNSNNTISSYGRYSSIGAGSGNFIDQQYSFIGGGEGNTTYGNYDVIVGGMANMVEKGIFLGNIVGGLSNHVGAHLSSIVGGSGNLVFDGLGHFVGGGTRNTITTSGRSREYSAIVGGKGNTIDGDYSIVGGGRSHAITGNYSVIVGGGGWGEYSVGNIVEGNRGFIGGGKGNHIHQLSTNGYSSIVGGNSNQIMLGSIYSIIGGGIINQITGSSSYGSVLGGRENVIEDSTFGFIGGGEGNSITGGSNRSSIAGGYKNRIYNRGSYSFVGGVNAEALHQNSFVRNNDPTMVFPTTRNRSFIINAEYSIDKTSGTYTGGVGINTNAPKAALDVSGSIVSNDAVRGNYISSITSIYANTNIHAGGNINASSYSVSGVPGMTTSITIGGCTMNFTNGLLTSAPGC